MERRDYEALYILHPHLNEEEVSSIMSEFEKSVQNLGGEVTKSDKQGRKKLAFQVNKLNDGYFVLSDLKLPSDKVQDLKKYFKLSDSYVRYMVSRKAG